jgi:predicted small lipoprotein YifL
MKHSMIKYALNFFVCNNMMTKTVLTILVLACHTVLVGCGTTGPLYIPEQRYPQKTQDEAPKAPDAKPSEQTINE